MFSNSCFKGHGACLKYEDLSKLTVQSKFYFKLSPPCHGCSYRTWFVGVSLTIWQS